MYKSFIFLIPSQSSPHPPSKDSIIHTFGPQTINLSQHENLNSLIIYFLVLIRILKVYLQ